MSNFKIEIHDDKPQPKRRKIRLYFVGLDFYRAHKGHPPPIAIKGSAFAMPDIGRDVLVDELIARDMIFKTRWLNKDTLVAEEQGGAEMAAMILEAIESGKDVDEAELKRINFLRQAEANISDDELVEMLKQRGISSIPKELLLGVKSAKDDKKKSTKKSEVKEDGRNDSR